MRKIPGRGRDLGHISIRTVAVMIDLGLIQLHTHTRSGRKFSHTVISLAVYIPDRIEGYIHHVNIEDML